LLTKAAIEGNLTIVEQLLLAGANIEGKDKVIYDRAKALK